MFLVIHGPRALVECLLRQRKYLKLTELSAMRTAWGGATDNNTLGLLRKYIQTSSSLSFACRAKEYPDAALAQLHTRAGDYVSARVFGYA